VTGHGLLTGQIRTVDDFSDEDWRKTNPRFTGDNFQRNLALVDEVTAIGAEIGATPAQTALAWLLSRGDDIAPIPGTRRIAWVEENTAAADIELAPVQLQRLDSLEPAAGERNDQANMRPERIGAAMRQGYAGSSVNYEIHHDDLPPTCQGAVRRDLVKSTSTCDQRVYGAQGRYSRSWLNT